MGSRGRKKATENKKLAIKKGDARYRASLAQKFDVLGKALAIRKKDNKISRLKLLQQALLHIDSYHKLLMEADPNNELCKKVKDMFWNTRAKDPLLSQRTYSLANIGSMYFDEIDPTVGMNKLVKRHTSRGKDQGTKEKGSKNFLPVVSTEIDLRKYMKVSKVKENLKMEAVSTRQTKNVISRNEPVPKIKRGRPTREVMARRKKENSGAILKNEPIPERKRGRPTREIMSVRKKENANSGVILKNEPIQERKRGRPTREIMSARKKENLNSGVILKNEPIPERKREQTKKEVMSAKKNENANSHDDTLVKIKRGRPRKNSVFPTKPRNIAPKMEIVTPVRKPMSTLNMRNKVEKKLKQKNIKSSKYISGNKENIDPNETYSTILFDILVEDSRDDMYLSNMEDDDIEEEKEDSLKDQATNDAREYLSTILEKNKINLRLNSSFDNSSDVCEIDKPTSELTRAIANIDAKPLFSSSPSKYPLPFDLTKVKSEIDVINMRTSELTCAIDNINDVKPILSSPSKYPLPSDLVDVNSDVGVIYIPTSELTDAIDIKPLLSSFSSKNPLPFDPTEINSSVGIINIPTSEITHATHDVKPLLLSSFPTKYTLPFDVAEVNCDSVIDIPTSELPYADDNFNPLLSSFPSKYPMQFDLNEINSDDDVINIPTFRMTHAVDDVKPLLSSPLKYPLPFDHIEVNSDDDMDFEDSFFENSIRDI